MPGRPRISPGDVVCEQALHECAGRVAGCRVNDEARGLVHDHEVLVLVGDAQVHRFRRELGGLLLRRFELHLFAAGEPLALAERPAVDEHRPRFEQPFRHPTRADLRQGGEEAVEPLAGRLVRNALLHARAGAGTTVGPRPRAPAAEPLRLRR